MTEAKYFPVWPDLNLVNKHFTCIIWALYTIHEHSENEALDKISNKFAQKIYGKYVVCRDIAFLAVNDLDV